MNSVFGIKLKYKLRKINKYDLEKMITYANSNANQAMKIIYIGTRNHPILEALIHSSHEIKGIAESTLNKKASVLKSLLFNAYDLLQSIKGKSVLQLSSQAKKQKVPYLVFSEEQKTLANWVSSLKPDIIVVHSMYQLLKKDVFSIPKYGAINYHPSLLPNYPGSSPDFWVYYNMDLNPGGTVHLINDGEDTGEIIYAQSFPLELGTSYNEYKAQYCELGAELVLKALKDIETDSMQLKKQIETSEITRARRIKKEEHQSFIDWQTWSTERVFHFLRGTLTYVKSVPLPKNAGSGSYWKVVSFIKELSQNKPGTIKNNGKQYLLYCKDGAIIMELKKSFSLVIKSLFL
ncbi:methionyl-tRNA formyltransferase [Solitalea koreensis]|uniref:Methionyl-tRNA formyltransferase n=1 Tax=Solitalea koreensis TaxID=543615 RepID=A0A521BAF9_9SPHI|nr:formyltransferase family protein [Solitalea koreensis]SMO44059.1 Methionyl-tRNA formyltransferase [Solitalea koreensis]